MRRLYLGVLLCGAALCADGARRGAWAGGARGLELRLRAPAGCPSVAALQALVAEHLGDDAPAPALRIEVAVRRDRSRWLARLEVRGDGGGRRDLEGATCREVIDAAALVIALAVEGDGHVVGGEPLAMVLEGEPEVGGRREGVGGAGAAAGGGEDRDGARVGGAARVGGTARVGSRAPTSARRPGGSTRAAGPSIEPEPEPDGAGMASPEAAANRGRPAEAAPDYDFDRDPGAGDRGAGRAGKRTRVALRAGGAGESGTLPRAAAGVEAALSVWRSRYGLELSGAYWPERAARPDGGGPGALVGLWTSGARGCRAVSLAAVCAGGELGRMTGRGMDLPDQRVGSAWWGALSGSVWVRRSVGRAAIYAGIEGLVPVTRPRFQLDDDTLLYRPAALAARAMLGVELMLR